MPLSTPDPQNTDTNGIHVTWIHMTLLYIRDSKNASFRSYSTFVVYLRRVHIYPQYKYAYVHAHGHELSGCVCADTDALYI